MGTPMRRPWITPWIIWTRSRPRASTFSGKPSHGGRSWRIGRDEEAPCAKERVFSPRGTEGGWDVRDQPPEFWDQFNASPPPGAHLRIHPILHWTEADIWAYTQRENIPIIPLYLAKQGKRYRSLGDADITNPVASTASNIEEILIELDGTKVPERAGRALDHETEDPL